MVDLRRQVRGLASFANRVGATPIGLSGRYRLLATPENGQPRSSSAALQRAVGGKVVLITGASSGIGEATARLLASARAVVLLVARGPAELERVRNDITAVGGTASCYPCDLADFDALDALITQVLAEHGHVDVLVNNAGRSIRRKVAKSEARFHDFERPMRLNYFAAIRLVLGILPVMCSRGSGQVINISSWAVQVRPPRFSGYTASKAALEAWSDCVQAEVREQGVLFTTIRMPLVRTPMIAPTPAYRRLPALTPDAAAKTVADAIVCRPRRLRPAFSQVLALTEAVSPRSMDRVRKRYT